MGKHFLRKSIILIFLCFIGIFSMTNKAEAGLLDNPYVTFSPDGNAFTTNADETDTEWYEHGYTIRTGNESTLGEPEIGEHIYSVIESGNVRVGKWIVQHKPARCIHVRTVDVPNFHGIYFVKDVCFSTYYSGWIAYCADCDQKVTDGLFYMSDEAAASIKELDMYLAYYYRCPYCTHLEQGYELNQHVCKEISANQYNVRYHANFGKGYMPKSKHMYNNATMYEGNRITPQKTLTLNSYTRVGYEFIGWNTRIDGSGESFGDGQEILNLCSGEQDNIILYAQWKKSQSILQIDPNGGKYKGMTSIMQIPGEYGSDYIMDVGAIEPPVGAVIHFDTNGGDKIADITGKREFSEWSFRQPLQGILQGNVYTYKGSNGTVDYATAIYKYKPVVLPDCKREGYSFGGWYFDKEMTQIAGAAGDEILTTKDITLYACWVELQLKAEDNYQVNAGIGAVDLSWEQKDSNEKTYLIYQKQEGKEWQRIYSADDISTEKHINKTFEYTGRAESYIIPYNGYYRLTLKGAQGENYESFSGGRGGQVTAVIYLEKGEELNYVIGGQDGYNGGGIGSVYGNGGGYTSVSTVDKGILLIAGGGGGATSQADGQAGGSLLSNIEDHKGQNGMAGGGGGYQGGTSGSAILHNHVSNCSHVHVGTPTANAGCYTVKTVCKNTAFSKIQYGEKFYYGNRDNNGNRIYCARCGSYECPGHRDKKYRYECTLCKASYKDSKPASCTSYKYGLGCNKTEGYICGYENGQVIGAAASYGGSNYVNDNECLTYEESVGVNKGNGVLLIEAVHIGFIGNNYLSGVKANDYASPDKVSIDTVEIKAVDENKVNIAFNRPSDRGTIYYHMAESYQKESNQLISVSNQTMNTITSGVYGYRYRMDKYESTTVTNQDISYIDSGENPYISVMIDEQDRYLHVASMDKAGNLSETVHIPISSQDIIFWPVITEQMSIEEGENVLKSGNEYYVKADGTTPFTISFNSRLCGTALKNYQVNQLHFITQNTMSDQGEGILKITTPVENVIAAGSSTYQNQDIKKQYENTFCLVDMSFTEVRRANYCKDMEITQVFSMPEELDGAKIRLTPQAGVILDKVNVLSNETLDLANSIYLIADGTSPDINGLDIPEEITDTKDGKWEYTLQINAADSGSGLKTFWLEIRNSDSGGYEKIEDTDKDGMISLKLSSENALFSGKFYLLAIARDYVGNESVQTYGLDGITVDAYVEKMIAPQEDIFKKGESGKLHIQTTGYIERVEVIFPEEWSKWNPALNKEYTYDVPDFMQIEELEFMVPLQIPDSSYPIVIKAYKGDKTVEATPELLTISVSGSILNEIRTRLR